MDNKNVFIAIALSMSVLLFWGAFFETPRQTKDNNLVQEKNETNLEPKNNNITPTLNEEIKENLFLGKILLRRYLGLQLIMKK